MSNIVGRFPAVVRPTVGSCRSRTSVMRLGLILALGGWTAILFLGAWVLAADRGGSPNDFDATVAPILVRRCLDCHSGADPKGKLDLSRRASAFAGGESGPAIVAGQARREPALGAGRGGRDAAQGAAARRPRRPRSATGSPAGPAWGTDPIDPSRSRPSRRAGRDWWSLQPVRRPEPPDGRATRTGSARRSIAFVLHEARSRAGSRPRPRPTGGR